MLRTCRTVSVALAAAIIVGRPSLAEDKEKPQPKPITIEDDLTATVPGDWKVVEPDFPRFRKAQFALPRAEGDDADGVLIVYHFGKGGGGSLDDNLERWYGMMEQAEGKSSKEVGKVAEIETGEGKSKIAITWLDLPGTYLDRPFPRSPRVTRRPRYRLFAAYVDGGSKSPYWIRAYGPDKTMLAERDGFVGFLKSIREK